MTSGLEKAFESATAPCRSFALWPIRLAMAGIFLFHGPGKFMMPGMAAMMGLSVPVWYLVGAAEIAGGAGFIAGGLLSGSIGTLITRLSGLAIIPVMLGAIIMVHWGQWGFMASDTHPTGGMEFQVLILAVAISALITGFSQNTARSD
jgi:putative oxidoreductase